MIKAKLVNHSREITLADGEAAIVFREKNFELFLPTEGTVDEDSPVFAAAIAAYIFQPQAFLHYIQIREELIQDLNAHRAEQENKASADAALERFKKAS